MIAPTVPEYIYSDDQARKEWIKVELRSRGLNYSIIASKLGKHRQAVSRGINNNDLFWQKMIAEAIGVRPEEIWPECYPVMTNKENRREKATA